MNRVLKRPMFRIGGSTGTGITSGLDQPRKQYAQGSEDRFMELVAELREQGFTQQEAIEEAKRRLDMAKGGRVGYANGTPNPYNMGAFSPGSTAGLLTGIGLDLLSRPPGGNIFQTVASAAKGPLERFQAGQAEAMKTASDRAFARELAQEEREFEEGQLEKKLAAQKEIASMDQTDTTKRIQAIADTKYEGDIIKAQREVEFATTTYPNLTAEYGQESVATTVIDSSGLQKQKDLDRFVKQNPTLARQVVYDVATGKAMKFVKNTVTNKFELIPASSADVEDTGDMQPAPRENPGLFGQPTKPGKELKEILPDFRDTGFDEDFYQ
jgi:hypothetical protein